MLIDYTYRLPPVQVLAGQGGSPVTTVPGDKFALRFRENLCRETAQYATPNSNISVDTSPSSCGEGYYDVTIHNVPADTKLNISNDSLHSMGKKTLNITIAEFAQSETIAWLLQPGNILCIGMGVIAGAWILSVAHALYEYKTGKVEWMECREKITRRSTKAMSAGKLGWLGLQIGTLIYPGVGSAIGLLAGALLGFYIASWAIDEPPPPDHQAHMGGIPRRGDKPTLQQLQSLDCNGRSVRVVQSVAPDWERLALALGFEAEIEIIRRDYDHRYGCERATMEIFIKWLNRGSTLGLPITWNTLILCLRQPEVGKAALADELEAALR